MKGKHVSLALMIAGAVCIVAGFVLNGIFKWGYSAFDIVLIGGSVSGLGTPIGVNLFVEAITGLLKARIAEKS